MHCYPRKIKIEKFPRPTNGARVRVRGVIEFQPLTLALSRMREREFMDELSN